MKRLLSVGCGILASLLLFCEAVHGKEYKVYQMAQTPVIDGKLTDHAWGRIPAGRGFRTLKKGNPYARERFTSFKMGWKGDYLYLALVRIR